MRRGLSIAFGALGAFTLGCGSLKKEAATQSIAPAPRQRMPSPGEAKPSGNLREYALSACLAAGGMRGEAVDVAQSFYLEMADEPWRYDKAKTCAAEFVARRRNALGRNLLIPDCLAFMRSDGLGRILAMSEQDGATSCADPGPTVVGPEGGSAPALR